MNRFDRLFALTAFFAVWLVSSAGVTSAQPKELLPTPTAQDKQLLESGNAIARQISVVEWLGPLAPIALSPFFGLACLSGIATYGPEWLQQRSAIFGEASPLNNPALFWTMVVLTVVTSLPRLSKVSKPLALAAEKLEAYSVVIIVIAMRMFATGEADASAETALTQPMMLQAGMASVPMDLVLAMASAINILVINGVKLFCELLIWLTPIPLVDALVEAANKGVCVGLTALYCWSPSVATIVNLLMLAICMCVYRWTQRRILYYLDVIAGPWLQDRLPWFFGDGRDGQTVFLAERWQGLPPLTKLYLSGSAGEGWLLTGRRWCRAIAHRLPPSEPTVENGLLAQSVRFVDKADAKVVLYRRKSESPSASVAYSV